MQIENGKLVANYTKVLTTILSTHAMMLNVQVISSFANQTTISSEDGEMSSQEVHVLEYAQGEEDGKC